MFELGLDYWMCEKCENVFDFREHVYCPKCYPKLVPKYCLDSVMKQLEKEWNGYDRTKEV